MKRGTRVASQRPSSSLKSPFALFFTSFLSPLFLTHTPSRSKVDFERPADISDNQTAELSENIKVS